MEMVDYELKIPVDRSIFTFLVNMRVSSVEKSKI